MSHNIPLQQQNVRRRCPMPERAPYRRQGVDMDLPAGKTCGDCVHSKRCTMMFGHIPADEYCDWSPSRFRAAAVAEPARTDRQRA